MKKKPAAPAATPRFVKLDAQLKPLPATAKKWLAVLDNQQQLIFSAETLGPFNHDGAVKACADLTLCGKNGWRLPDDHELSALADRTRRNPAINNNFFPDTKGDWYWTSRPVVGHSDFAWCVDFGYGGVLSYHRGPVCFVRAVRSAVPSQ